VNKPLRNMTAIALLLALGTLVSAQWAAAAETKPALTMAFAGYDQLIGSLKALDKLSGHSKLAAKAEAAIDMHTNGQGLAGLDKSRPWSITVGVNDASQPVVHGYIPVTDLKKLLATIPMPGGPPAANANGVYEIPANDRTAYLKQKGKWAVFSDSEDSLESAAAEPGASVTDLTKKYLFAVRGSVQNVPAAVRDNALQAFRGIVELSMQLQGNLPEAQQEMAKANVKQIFDKLEVLSKELDSLEIGVGMDPASKALYLDVETRGVEGSDLSKKIEAMRDAKTDFAGFAVPGAAMTMLSSSVSDDEDVAAAKTQLANAKKLIAQQLEANEQLGDKREKAKELVGDFFDVFEKTIELKKSDGGMSIILNEGPVLIAGARIAGGGKLEKTLKKLVAEIGEDDADIKDKVKFDAAKYKGVKFHVATIPVPDAKAQEVLGETVQLVVGTSESAVYFGAGKEPIAAIKKAMDASKAEAGKEINPVDMVFSVAPFAKFMAKVIPENENAMAKKHFSKVAEVLEKFGKDRITVTVKPIEGGMRTRFNVEPGVVKSILDVTGGDSEEAEDK
jgi:hypothetical protein